jgi:hypothetical protein
MSLEVLKKKTMNSNPRVAPISGSNNGSFGFSLNGTYRGSRTIYDINSPNSSVCANEPDVVKTTVMNTRGLLSKRLRGIERIPPVAPIRTNSANGSCGMGDIIEPAYSIDTQYWSNCNLNKFCTGPLSVNWVKKPIIPHGNQGIYIENIVKINGNSNNQNPCDSTKSFNGILGVLNLDGSLAGQGQSGCHHNYLSLSETELELLVKSHSIMPFYNSCKISEDRTPVRGIEKWTAVSKTRHCTNISKPGITTIDYGTYISRRLKINNYIPSQLECNLPQPTLLNVMSCRAGDNDKYWNNNIPPTAQYPYNSLSPSLTVLP